MISYLIRRALGPGVGGFWVGLVMVVTGIALTVFSAVISQALGFQVTLVFYGLIIFGLVRMVAGVPSLLGRGRAGGRGAYASRSAPGYASGYPSSGPAVPAFFAPPFEVTPGYCWQCGGRVKRGASICLNCGATQAAEKEEQPGRHDEYTPAVDPGAMPSPTHQPATNGPRRANRGDISYRPGRSSGNEQGYRPAWDNGDDGGYGAGPGPRRTGGGSGRDAGYGGYDPNGEAGGYGGYSDNGGSGGYGGGYGGYGPGPGPGRATEGNRDRRGNPRRGSRS